jgi:hypothetical protein
MQGLAFIQLQGVQAAGYTLFTSILNNEGGLWRGITQYLSVISRVPFASSHLIPSTFSYFHPHFLRWQLDGPHGNSAYYL